MCIRDRYQRRVRGSAKGAMGVQLIPPFNFGYVEENLYRCGLPVELNFHFLDKLNLKTIIYLASEPPSQQLVNFIEDNEIDLERLEIDSRGSASKPISEETILQGLSIVLHNARYPICVMDTQGRHRVGTLIGCLRKLQRWTLTAILEEYRRFAGSKVRLANEQFIELFDLDLVSLPQDNSTLPCLDF
eukprot:TRINITY_DN25994_c0_g1_i1.p1 TRINITY_DN25994_c0_g1~~TRINITY_DN25994_c0_g1_i1.p1  ORF type:complete len:188 (+),score=37.75 TRINITY_DN25994_c0_g1_i1:159-722(+)